MATVTTVVKIAAPPALVRSLFLDFPSLSQWHSSHFSSLTVLQTAGGNSSEASPPSKSIGETLQAGDKLKVGLAGGMSFTATVVENTAQRFAWRGGWSYILIGEHSFEFNQSDPKTGGTTLTHGETFTGGLVALCRPFMKSDKEQTSPGFERFNADLKKWAEQKAGSVNPE